ncbi:MAG: ChaN family lipoprotein [Geobacteraceae bacterium]|nr:ChaN family lipoprotein [Geobacteraceae bacterium]NTW78851.1 ChaN family lipoprotein [Geobacteraceae bacterium]
MRNAVLLIIVLVCSVTLPANLFAGEVVTRMSDRKSVSFSQMITEVEGSDIVFVAETHDNKKSHELQLDVIRSLRAKKTPLAIGLEMFQTDSQKALDDWIEGSITEQDFKADYAKNWSYDWSLYRDIFIFARDNRIPMLALNVPKRIVSKVARQGFASLTPEEKKNLPPAVTCDLNKPQTESLKSTFQAVFKHEVNGKIFANFCAAQAVRNSGMAMAIVNGQKRHPDRKIVVLAGTWHAVKHGVPESLASLGSLGFKAILFEIPELNLKNATADITDYMIRW